MSSHLLSHGLFKAFKVSPLFLIACVGTVTVGPVVDCNSLDPENQCPTCDYGTVYTCDCYDLASGGLVKSVYPEGSSCSPNGCPLACSGYYPEAIDWPCPQPSDPTEGAYSCASWDPDALITGPIGDDYGIYLNLITSLRNDPTPLFECDSARVNVTSGLVIQDAVSTDMAYLLGLRNGDLLVEVNGMSLADPLDAYVAYNQLWELDGETEYTLKIERNSQYVYLTYGVLAVQP